MSLFAHTCDACARERRIRSLERRRREAAPPLPPTVGPWSWEMIWDRITWLREAGWLEREIADHLNDHELRTPSWNRPWTQASVSYWLRFGATSRRAS